MGGKLAFQIRNRVEDEKKGWGGGCAELVMSTARVAVPCSAVITLILLLTRLRLEEGLNNDTYFLAGMFSFCMVCYLVDRDKTEYPIDFEE